MELADKVRTRREELGMSQEDLAFKMGYKSRSSINKIETGREVSQKIIVRLAEALNVSVRYLMSWDDDVEDEKEKPTTSEDDGLLDGLTEIDMDIIKKLPLLSPEQKKEYSSYLSYLLSKQEP